MMSAGENNKSHTMKRMRPYEREKKGSGQHHTIPSDKFLDEAGHGDCICVCISLFGLLVVCDSSRICPTGWEEEEDEDDEDMKVRQWQGRETEEKQSQEVDEEEYHQHQHSITSPLSASLSSFAISSIIRHTPWQTWTRTRTLATDTDIDATDLMNWPQTVKRWFKTYDDWETLR